MIVTCPACSTRYHAVDDTVGNRARRVRCVKCAHEWVIDPVTGVTSTEHAGAGESSNGAGASSAQTARPAAAMASGAADSGTGGAVYLTRPARPRHLDMLISALAALVVLAAIVFGLWHARVSIVRAFPSLGGLYRLVGVEVNAVGMEIRNTKWQIEDHGGVPVLVVSGKVANISKETLAVPRLRLVLRDGDKHELYHWTVILERKELKPGDFTRFSTTLKNPPLEAHDVQIRFAPKK
jgi:predicted Zn finger-like uncharacterized protein